MKLWLLYHVFCYSDTENEKLLRSIMWCKYLSSTTCRCSCVGKTGTTQFLVYFLCKHNTSVYLLTVIISENHSCILRYKMFQVLKPYIFIKDDCPWSIKCSYHNIELKNSFRKVHKKLYILKRFCKPGLGYRKRMNCSISFKLMLQAGRLRRRTCIAVQNGK